MGQAELLNTRAQRLVVIGNGMAGGRAMEELFAKDHAPTENLRKKCTVFGAEPRVNYNRIMLSPVLSGEKAFEDIIIHDEAWYARHGVELRRGQSVVAIDRSARTSRPRAARSSVTTSWSSPRGRSLSSSPFPAPISRASSPSAISTTSR